MPISTFATRVVTVPPDQGAIGEAPSAVSHDFVTLVLRADDGTEGIGYAGFASPLLTAALKETLDALAEETIGEDPLRVEAIQERLLALGGGGAPAGLVTRAVSAIDVALWDLKGQALGEPLWKLLGGHRDRVPAYASGYLWRGYGADALAKRGGELVKDGFRAMKFRMGDLTNAEEIARMEALREAVGDDISLMVDINQGWDVNRSIVMGREMELADLYWLEDPVHHQDYAGLARIAEALDTPIAAGEYHYGIAPFRTLLEHRSIDIVMIDLLRAGGISGWIKVAHMAECYNLPVVSHLAPEVLVHAVAAVPNGLIVEHMPWTLPLFTEEPRMEGGDLILTDAPGLGLEFTAEAAP